MKCNCSSPNSGCQNAKEKVNGHYCSLDFPKSGEVEIRSLRYGEQFSFKELPWIVCKCLGVFYDGVKYEKPCGWKWTENNLKRIIDKV